jgi:integrase
MAKLELNDRFLRAVPKPAERTRYWDTKQPGLVLVVEPTGHKSWKIAYRFKGRLEWYSLGSADKIGLAVAREAAKVSLASVVLGLSPQAKRREEKASMGATFEAIAKRYVEEHAMRRNRSWQQADFLVRRYVIPKFGKLKLQDIARRGVVALTRELTEQGKPALANQVRAAISAIFNWAIREEIANIAANPCQGVPRNKPQSRERVLSEAELPRFWQAFDELGAPGAALKLILLSGQRPGEVRHLRGSDVERGWWSMPGKPEGKWCGTKNGQSHRVWLTGEALALLEAVADARISETRLAEAMAKANELAGVPRDKRARPHDLRRTHGTLVTSLGYGRDGMNRLQNHKEGGIASVYDRHGYADENRRIQEAVTRRIMALVEGGPIGNVVQLQRA